MSCETTLGQQGFELSFERTFVDRIAADNCIFVFCQFVSIWLKQRSCNHASNKYEGVAMGYLISFLLGVFVATIGVSGASPLLDKAVKTT